MSSPELSVVIAIASDALHLRGCLLALAKQQERPEMEILVPHDGRDPNVEQLSAEFPDVRFLHFNLGPSGGPDHEHLDQLRARGLQAAHAEIVAFLEDHARAAPDWARRVVHAHQSTNAAIGGAIENEIDHTLNWAVYFCDFGRYQNPVPAGPSLYISDVNSSYKRAALERIKHVWQDSFHETTVNAALITCGETLWLSPEIVVYQHREHMTLASALRERFVWGRYYAAVRVREMGAAKRFLFLFLSPALVAVLVLRKVRDIVQKKRLTGKFIQALPLTALLTELWSLGEFTGYLTARHK